MGRLWPHNVRLRWCWVGSEHGEVTPCGGGCCPRALLAGCLSGKSRRCAGTARPRRVCSWHTARQEGQHRPLSPRELLGGSSPAPGKPHVAPACAEGTQHLCLGMQGMVADAAWCQLRVPPVARPLPAPRGAPSCANTPHLARWGPEAADKCRAMPPTGVHGLAYRGAWHASSGNASVPSGIRAGAPVPPHTSPRHEVAVAAGGGGGCPHPGDQVRGTPAVGAGGPQDANPSVPVLIISLSCRVSLHRRKSLRRALLDGGVLGRVLLQQSPSPAAKYHPTAATEPLANYMDVSAWQGTPVQGHGDMWGGIWTVLGGL